MEELMRTRLLVDGDGTGDDRRIFLLTKSFMYWYQNRFKASKDYVKSPKKVEKELFNDLLLKVMQCKHSIKKSHVLFQMNERELKKSQDLYNSTSTAVVDAKNRIENYVSELKRARLDRLRMIKYELLKSIIKTHPSRDSSQNKVRELEKYLKRLKERNDELSRKIEVLKKHTVLLRSSIRQLISDNQ